MNKQTKVLISTLIMSSVMSAGIPAYAWDSREDVNVMDTHKTIAVQALEIIKNDLKSDQKTMNVLNELQSNLIQYKKGSVAPDFGDVGVDRDYKLYQDHFYDPDSGENFTSNYPYPFYEIKDTAESQVRNYFSQAVAAWKSGDHENGSYLLGKAMHYFGDINEPHHTLNWTGGPGTAHTNFETYAEKTKDKYKINTMGSDKEEFNLNNEKPLLDFLTYQSNKYAKLSKNLEPKVSMSNTYADWDEALDISLKNAQKSSAIIVYKFLQEISSDKSIPLTSPIGRFHVVIKTDDEKYAGSDDYVYFGMELNNGKNIEFECNLAGNDFVTGSTGSYQFCIDDKEFDPSQVSRVWIRKQKYLGDDLKLKNISVYMQGKRVINEDINQWFTENYTHNISVNGLK